MRYADARLQFTAAAKAGRCPYLTQPGFRALSDDFRRKVLRHVDHVLRHKTGLDGDVLLEVDLIPLLPKFEAAAQAAPRATPSETTTHIVSSVRQFLLTLFPDSVVCRQRGRIRPGFTRLFDALTAEAEREREEAARRDQPNRLRVSARRSTLYHMQDLFRMNGIERMEDIPEDYVEVRRWATEAGWSKGQWETRINAYREARRLLPDPEIIAGLYAKRRAADRGLRSLDLHSELAKRNVEDDPRRLTTLALIRILAPDWADAIEIATAWGRARNRSDRWCDLLVDAASRFLASLIRLGRDPGDVDLMQLWLPTTDRADDPESGDPRKDRMVAKYCPDGLPTRPHPILARVLVDEQAPAAWRASSRKLVRSSSAAPNIVPYVNTLVHDEVSLWKMTELIYKESLSAMQPELWGTACANRKELASHMRDHNKLLQTTRVMDKSLLIGYGDLVCRGIPYLRDWARATLEEMDAYAGRPRHNVRYLWTLESRAHAALEDYIILALFTDDGLRVKNYANAILGSQILVEYDLDEEGKPIGLRKVWTHWRGYDLPRVRLKRPRDARGAERRRKRTVNRGLVDYDLLFRYLTWARPRDAVAGGLIDRTEDFNPLEDSFALYIRSRHLPTREYRTKPTDDYRVQTGAVTPGQLSTVVGTGIYDVMTLVLREDLPDWLDPERTEEWRGIFAAHALRSVITDYYGYYLDDWETASELTNTTRNVLEDAYKSAIGDRKQRLAKIGPENPTHFSKVVDAIQADWTDADWDRFWRSFDPNRPDRNLHLVLPIRGDDTGTKRSDVELTLVA